MPPNRRAAATGPCRHVRAPPSLLSPATAAATLMSARRGASAVSIANTSGAISSATLSSTRSKSANPYHKTLRQFFWGFTRRPARSLRLAVARAQETHRLVRTVTAGVDEGLRRSWVAVGGGAGLVGGPDVHDAVGNPGNVNEFLHAPTCLNFDTLPAVTGPGYQASCLSVVVGVGRVHTTTSRRARR
jgi:hypothetical protein